MWVRSLARPVAVIEIEFENNDKYDVWLRVFDPCGFYAGAQRVLVTYLCNRQPLPHSHSSTFPWARVRYRKHVNTDITEPCLMFPLTILGQIEGVEKFRPTGRSSAGLQSTCHARPQELLCHESRGLLSSASTLIRHPIVDPQAGLASAVAGPLKVVAAAAVKAGSMHCYQ